MTYQHRKSSFGRLNVDIGAMAQQLASDMIKAGREGQIKHREEQEKSKWSAKDEDVFFIGRRTAVGFYIESVEPYAKLGTLVGRGPTLEYALAEARMALARHIMAQKGAKGMAEAQERVAAIRFEVATVLDSRNVGSETGAISVGAGD